MFTLSNEDTIKAIELYSQKTPLKELAKEFHCNVKTISSFLKRNGVILSKSGYSSARKFSKEKEDEIISLYQNGMSQKDIATKYNTFNTSIRRVLLRRNVKIRSEAKVLRLCKHNPFKSYKKHDEKTEYFLGLLLTDGYISLKSKEDRTASISLGLTSTDDYIITAFRDWASPNQKITKTYQKLNGSYMSSVKITNQEAVDWLVRKGNFSRKSYECKIYCPITWHIFRGIFDGDGGLRESNTNGLNLFVCGMSKVFMSQVYNFLVSQGIEAKLRFVRPDKWHKNGLYYVTVYKYEQVIKVGLKMYENAHIFLKRKYEKWLAFYENKKNNYALDSGNDWQSNPEQNLPTL